MKSPTPSRRSGFSNSCRSERRELHQPITDEQREAVRKDFEAQAVDGMLDARETLTLVTLSWNY